MYKNGNTLIAFFIGLIAGAILGAVFALLYAAGAGDELRQKIQSGAEANWQKANLELDRVKQTIQDKTNQTELPDESLTAPAES